MKSIIRFRISYDFIFDLHRTNVLVQYIKEGDYMEKRTEILRIIYKYSRKNGYPPTVREICDLAGLKSPVTVHSHLNKLEKEGYINKEETHPRASSITEKGLDLVRKDNEDNLADKDYKVLLEAEKFLRTNRYPLIKEFEDIISKITYMLE